MDDLHTTFDASDRAVLEARIEQLLDAAAGLIAMLDAFDIPHEDLEDGADAENDRSDEEPGTVLEWPTTRIINERAADGRPLAYELREGDQTNWCFASMSSQEDLEDNHDEEDDRADSEPELGAPERHPRCGGLLALDPATDHSQEHWPQGCEYEDDHDGCEPEEDAWFNPLEPEERNPVRLRSSRARA